MARITLRSLFPAWEEALRLEIQASKDMGRRYPVTGGQRLGTLHGDEMYPVLYAFTLDADVYLPDDAPVKIHLGGRSWDGVLVSQTGFDITVALKHDLGETIPRAELSSEPWGLLEQLIARLREAAIDRERNWQLADLLLQGGPPVPGYRGEILAGQDTALKHALEHPVTFIWGPPGTGKTDTIAAIAHRMLEAGKRTLIVSHSNVAVDNAILRIGRKFPDAVDRQPGAVLRWGFVRLKELQDDDRLHSVGLLRKRYPHLDREERRWRDETRRLRRLVNDGQTDRRPDLAKAEQEWRRARERLRDREDFLVQQARTLGVTLSRAAANGLIYSGDNRWDCVILDEASMAYVPQSAYAATLAAERVIVVGDFKQLAPITLSSDERVKAHLGRDIFEFVGIAKLISEGSQWHPHLVMLNRQFRSHPQITRWPRKAIYSFGKGGQPLLEDGKPASDFARITDGAPFPNYPVILVDTSRLRPYVFTVGGSRFSPWTAVLSATFALQASSSQVSVGIISPFAAQSRLTLALLKDLFSDMSGHAREAGEGPVASTIHRFQGSERDVIIIDLVESWPMKHPSILLTEPEGHERLINVAVTRARGKLIVLADLDYLTAGFSSAGRLTRSNRILMFLQYANTFQYVINGAQLVEELPAIGPVRWYRPADAWRDWMKDLQSARRHVTVVVPSRGAREHNQNSSANRDHDPFRLSLKAALQRIPSGVSVRVWCDDPVYAQSLVASGAAIIGQRPFPDPVTVIDESILWLGYPPAWEEDPAWQPLRDVAVRWEGREGVRRLLDLWHLPREDAAANHPPSQQASDWADLHDWVARRFRCTRCSSPARLVVTNSSAFLACSQGRAKCSWADALPPATLQEYLDHVAYRCPSCGSATVARLNRQRRSLFIGCSAYPRCRFAISVPEALRGYIRSSSAT